MDVGKIWIRKDGFWMIVDGNLMKFV